MQEHRVNPFNRSSDSNRCNRFETKRNNDVGLYVQEFRLGRPRGPRPSAPRLLAIMTDRLLCVIGLKERQQSYRISNLALALADCRVRASPLSRAVMLPNLIVSAIQSIQYGGWRHPSVLGDMLHQNVRECAVRRSTRTRSRQSMSPHHEPCSVDDKGDHTKPVHNERRSLPHLLLELQ